MTVKRNAQLTAYARLKAANPVSQEMLKDLDDSSKFAEILGRADIRNTAAMSPVEASFWRRMIRPPVRARRIAAATALAVVVTLVTLLISPWNGSPTLSERALAAVGTGEVLHLVTTTMDNSDHPLVDIASGEPIDRIVKTEVWFDGDRHLEKSVVTVDGGVVDSTLQTSSGGWTSTGPIYTCEWIKTHPSEAKDAGVSCEGGSLAPETAQANSKPFLDPALAGFVDRYRSALASGAAKEVGPGTLDGRPVRWLEYSLDTGAERVAVDAKTFKPLQVSSVGDGPPLRVEQAETVTYAPGYFARPAERRVQTGGAIASVLPISPSEASRILGARAYWLGNEWGGLRLTKVVHQNRTVTYSNGSPSEADLVVFFYAQTDDPRREVEIVEAATCTVSAGWTCDARDPARPGVMGSFGPLSLVRIGNLYIGVINPVGGPNSIDIARALSPVEAR